MTRPQTFTEVIDAFGGPKAMSDRIEVNHATVRQWVSRNSIPPAYFADIAAAAKRGSGINLKALHEMHKAKTEEKA